MMKDLNIGIKITDTIILKINYTVLMVMGEVDIGIRLSTINPIAHTTMVDCCVDLLLLLVFTKLFMDTK